MIEVKDLVKTFGDVRAVDNISFSIEPGEIVAFLGPNGAGKTTTMRMMTGFLPPSSGYVRVDGHDVMKDPIAARKKVGYLPEIPPLYDNMKVKEYLVYVARLHGVKRLDIKKVVERELDRCGLGKQADRIIGNLSKGQRQRVGLAQALVHDPEILILDEPTIGLDPLQIREIRELVKNLGKNRTVILSTHILPEAQQVCGRVLIISQGRLVLDSKIGTLLEEEGKTLEDVYSQIMLSDTGAVAADLEVEHA
ncbi:MAG: ATP-binding cassette domain-containing protein [Deltaproteobacteria bacterium]|nr:ATP-binding cassette domain-containing protein [Deltaproteobacteria bacterium]